MTDNPLEAEGDIAADYLEGFLDIIDVDGDLEMDVENGRAMVAIVGEDLDDLVGDDGEVLDALQDLARLAVMRETGHYADERIMRRRSGALFWCRVRGKSLTPDDPFARGVWSFADLSDERPLVALTPRERDVAILTARGLTSKEIGRDLGLSYRTIEVYRARLLEKFGARKLPELVAKLSGMPL